LKSVIENEDILETSFIKITKPQPGSVVDQLIVSSNSPVILGVYDQLGNFTGVDPSQDLSADILSIKENIPGSTFLYTSESQNIFLPKVGIYDFIYKGIGDGPTTVTIENFTADTVLPIASYTDMPTTSNTIANFTIQSATPEDTIISLDTDGDGTTDETISPDGTEEEPTLSELLTLLKEKVAGLNIKDNLKKQILKKIEKLEKKIARQKKKIKTPAQLEKRISKLVNKGKISASDAQELLDILEQIESMI